MTSKERFHETMRFGAPDRVPYFEEGMRRDVIKAWHRQGLPRSKSISDLFKTDFFYEIDLDPLRTLQKASLSGEKAGSLLEDFTSGSLFRSWVFWQKLVRSERKKDQVLFLKVHRGFFLSMGVYDWQKFHEVILLLFEDPEFVHNRLHSLSKLIAHRVDNLLHHLDVDAVIFSEPIGGNEGPLMSPDMYETFVLHSYKPIIEILHKHGIETVILRTYANIRPFIPCILKNGFNCLWACETNSAAMDYRDLRKTFGRDLRLIGGLDLDTLRHDKTAIRKEIEEKVPPLIAGGGYIPIADGRVRKEISFENYCYYRRLLEQIISGKHEDS